MKCSLPTIYLTKRNEPLAMRGEKLFVQGCLSCHSSQEGIAKAQSWSGQHPAIKGAPSLDERDQRALRAYLDIFKSENTVPAAATQ